jgi:hypothetical protein
MKLREASCQATILADPPARPPSPRSSAIGNPPPCARMIAPGQSYGSEFASRLISMKCDSVVAVRPRRRCAGKTRDTLAAFAGDH